MADRVQVQRDGTVWLGRDVTHGRLRRYAWQKAGRVEKRSDIHPRFVGYARDGREVFASAIRSLVVDAIIKDAELDDRTVA